MLPMWHSRKSNQYHVGLFLAMTLHHKERFFPSESSLVGMRVFTSYSYRKLGDFYVHYFEF